MPDLRRTLIISFYTGLFLAGSALGIERAPAQPAAIYILSGTIQNVVPGGAAACGTAGTALTGLSYFPGFAAQGRLNTQAFTVVIKPTAGSPAIIYNFPFVPQGPTSDFLQYILPPETATSSASFTFNPTGSSNSSLSFTLTTTTGSQLDPAKHGSCTTTYQMTLKKGLPPKLRDLL